MGSWVVRLPFGLFIGHDSPDLVVSSRDEWYARERLVSALLPVYAAARGWRRVGGLQWLDRAVEKARRVAEEWEAHELSA